MRVKVIRPFIRVGVLHQPGETLEFAADYCAYLSAQGLVEAVGEETAQADPAADVKAAVQVKIPGKKLRRKVS